jgi:CobQ/CobB/MinD/ParA nucleotide binding domain
MWYCKKSLLVAMRTIALIAQKGGAGKTTLALSLSIAAEKAGASSVIIDLDPQATACNWGDRREAATPVIVDAQPAPFCRVLCRRPKRQVWTLPLSIPRHARSSSQSRTPRGHSLPPADLRP